MRLTGLTVTIMEKALLIAVSYEIGIENIT